MKYPPRQVTVSECKMRAAALRRFDTVDSSAPRQQQSTRQRSRRSSILEERAMTIKDLLWMWTEGTINANDICSVFGFDSRGSVRLWHGRSRNSIGYQRWRLVLRGWGIRKKSPGASVGGIFPGFMTLVEPFEI